MLADAAHPFCPSCGAVFRSPRAHCPVDGGAIELRSSDPMVGRSLHGRYRIVRLAGFGGSGRVYRAVHLKSTADLAVKILYGELAADPRHSERFAREASSARGLSHPNIVRLLDFGSTEGGLPFLVMEYVEGRPLSSVIREEAPLSRERARLLLADLCRALSYVHRKGLVHRDLKGGNVLVTRAEDRERAKLFDFGIALATEIEPAGRLTTRERAVGTLTFMAPEQAVSGQVDHRADLFSLGVLLYQMLAGKSPFEGPPTLVALQNATTRAPPIAQRVPGLAADPLLEAVSLKLMAKRPCERFQSADEVLEAIDAP
jgi:eukaryotic-like serine/threonine-protein kinase